jgi:cell division protein FtsW (lipid II flippase)
MADRCQDSVQPKEQTTPLEAAKSAASILHQARVSAANAAKADGSLEMLPKLWLSLSVWSLAGLSVLHLGRRSSRTLGVSLLVWASAYALTRPHLEWLGLGGLLGGWLPVAWLVGAAALLWPVRVNPADSLAITASRCAYPGFVLFVGLGWMLLADLSTYADPDNRFHALYQQAYVFLAFLLVSLLPALGIPLARLGLGLWSLTALLAAGRIKRTLIGWGLGLVLAVGLLALTKLFFTMHRQNTSEVFRFILLSGLAWFLLARAEALASPWLSLAQNRPWRRKGTLALRLSLWGLRVKLAMPLLLLSGFVAGGFWVTQDKGPLLVALYAGAIFFSLFVARFSASRVGERLGLGLGLLAILPYVWAVSYALFLFGGHFGEYIAERLESARTPFLASNDQIARILWFQEAALENGGFGLGFAPWCGESGGVCQGVPPQIQSDYIHTALVGVFGNASWGLLALFVFWLWRLARAHPAVTSGRVEADGMDQAWLSWMALCWVGLTLAQMAVTVAGNLGWLPLTGITFPFLSYGAWSLLGNTLFLGLFLHLHRRM